MMITSSIKKLGLEFYKRPENFRIEEELRSRLVGYLREEFPKTKNDDELVRPQFPTKENPYAHYDVVILTEKSSKEFASHYGHLIQDSVNNLKLTALFEIKQVKGKLNYSKKIIDDIKRLIDAINLKITDKVFMLIFIHGDHDWGDTKQINIVNKYVAFTKTEPNLEIFCFVRTGKHLHLKGSKFSYITI